MLASLTPPCSSSSTQQAKALGPDTQHRHGAHQLKPAQPSPEPLKIESLEYLLQHHPFNPDFTQRYVLSDKQLGTGGFGFVLVASRIRPEIKCDEGKGLAPGQDSVCQQEATDVAVKFIRKDRITPDSLVFSASRGCLIPVEVELMQDLDHPHIVKFLDFYEDENILINDSYDIKLCDFGSAARVDKSEKFKYFLGTAQYAAPEILRKEVYAGPKAESWAVGCCLFIMLTGVLPFTSNDAVLNNGMYRIDVLQLMSRQARDVIKGLLRFEPRNRMTLSDLEKHEWLNSSF
ncbi:MAG: hypothetical protein SGCHY_001795 [Lobulomycetales sp.]